MRLRLTLFSLLVTFSVLAQPVTYYIQGLHRQPNAKLAREYLGIVDCITNYFPPGCDSLTNWCSWQPEDFTPLPYSIGLSNLLLTVGEAGTATNLASGLIATNLTLINNTNSFSGIESGWSFTGILQGDGSGLTNLNASYLTQGEVPLARLSGITSNQLDPGTWFLATNAVGGGAPPGWCDNLTNWCSTVPSNFTTFAYSLAMSNYFQRTNPVMIMHSDEYVAWQTNGFMAMGPGTNRLGLILSNGFSRATMDSYCGVYKPFLTTDGTNWFSYPTNVPVEFGLLQDLAAPDCTPAGISNLVVFSFNNPGRFHVTNILFSQYLIVDRPKWELQAAPFHTVKVYAQKAVKNQTNWAFIPAQTRVDYHNNHERYTDEWQRTLTVSGATNRLEWQWLQTNIWTLTAPSRPAIDVSSYSISLDSYTNFTVILPAAYTSSVPVVLYTHYLVPTDWRALPRTTTIVGNTLKITFSVPSVDVGFFKIVLDNATPAIGALNGVLELTPRTVAATNSTTWNRGAGLFCFDANNLYVSTGTNSWKMLSLTGSGSGSFVLENFLFSNDARTNQIGFAANGTNYGLAIGGKEGISPALGYNYGAAVGVSSEGYDYGASLGYQANGKNKGVAIGYRSNGRDNGVSIGYSNYAAGGVSVGHSSSAGTLGVAIGRNCKTIDDGIAIGYASTNGPTGGTGYRSIAIGYKAIVPDGFGGTIELGEGTASLNGGFNLWGKGIADKSANLFANTLIVTNGASINSRLTVNGTDGITTNIITGTGVMLCITNGVLLRAVAGEHEFLRLKPTTINNSNDSTFGFGAGLICADSSHIYVSTGTNKWKRVSLTSW